MWGIIDRVKKEPVLIIVFIVYIVLVFIAITRHEPWADEAQDWLIARDSSLTELALHKLRYAGHPILWYLILFLPSRILSYELIGVIPFVFSVLGTFLLLFYSPFPKLLKILMPFTYFLFFQYAVIARSYVLLPFLLYLSAILFKDRFNKPFLFVSIQILLSFTSVLAFLIAGSVMFLFAIELIRFRKKLSKILFEKNIFSLVVFFVFVVLLLLHLWPPSNLPLASRIDLNPINVLETAILVMSLSFSSNVVLSFAFVIFSLIWFVLKRSILFFVLPVSLAIIFLSAKYYNSWHQGVVFLTWIYIYWISENFKPKKTEIKTELVARYCMHLLLFIIVMIQIYWSASAFYSDFYKAYSPGKAVAEYIKRNNLVDKEIYAVSYWSVSVLPYFDQNIFANYDPTDYPYFLIWAFSTDRKKVFEKIDLDKPDLVIVSRPDKNDEYLDDYELVGYFKGSLYWKSYIKEDNGISVFRRI